MVLLINNNNLKHFNMMFKKVFILLLFQGLAVGMVNAQLKVPATSPLIKMTQTVGLSELSLSYSRPSVKGRQIFGNVVPYDEYWRTGANGVTKFTTSEDIAIEGQSLSKGEYVILTIPGKESWTVNFYTLSSGSWSKYVEQAPDLSIPVKANKSADPRKSLFIYFDDLSYNSTVLKVEWSDVTLALNIHLDEDEKILADIQKTMSGPSMFDYFNASNYMYETEKDLNQALEYIKKANEGEKQLFFAVRLESLILHKLGQTQEAIETAQEALQLAQKAGNKDFVRLNMQAIEEWSRNTN